jgi:hypothetical protein
MSQDQLIGIEPRLRGATVEDAGRWSQRFQSRAHPRTWVSAKPLLHNNICSTPSHLVQEGTVSAVELCSGSGGGLSTREESASKVTSAPEVSGWQGIMTEIITMAETLALNDVA